MNDALKKVVRKLSSLHNIPYKQLLETVDAELAEQNILVFTNSSFMSIVEHSFVCHPCKFSTDELLNPNRFLKSPLYQLWLDNKTNNSGTLVVVGNGGAWVVAQHRGEDGIVVTPEGEQPIVVTPLGVYYRMEPWRPEFTPSPADRY